MIADFKKKTKAKTSFANLYFPPSLPSSFLPPLLPLLRVAPDQREMLETQASLVCK